MVTHGVHELGEDADDEERSIVICAARAAEIERVEREVDDALAGRLREVIDGVATAPHGR